LYSRKQKITLGAEQDNKIDQKMQRGE